LRASYDRAVDVLHLAAGDPSDVEGEGLPRGVELDFSVEDGRPCGVTIIGFKRNGWSDDLVNLADTVSRHLSLDPPYVIKVIQQSIGRAKD
jgi:hypothetical protein